MPRDKYLATLLRLRFETYVPYMNEGSFLEMSNKFFVSRLI